jgi:hypothetical protein
MPNILNPLSCQKVLGCFHILVIVNNDQGLQIFTQIYDFISFVSITKTRFSI